MSKGWRISYIKDGELKIAIVGISEKNAAISQVIGDQTGISGIGADELSDDDFDKLGLSEGKVIESAKAV
jgi:hypothetical protein